MSTSNPIYLVVDNHIWVVRWTKWCLEQSQGKNINVVTGQNGEDAVELYDEIVKRGDHSRIRIVMVGCHMPIITGMEAIAVIRSIEQRHQVTKPVKIIGTTSDLNDEVSAEFFNAGANYVLSKPIPDGVLEGICALP